MNNNNDSITLGIDDSIDSDANGDGSTSLSTIHDYPERLASHYRAITALTRQLDSVRDSMQEHEDAALVTVLDCKGDDGKPLYTNEARRAVAYRAALNADEEYVRLQRRAREIETSKAQRQADVETLRARFRIVLIDYEAEHLGSRATTHLFGGVR